MSDGEIRIEARVDDSKIPDDMRKLNNKLESYTTNFDNQIRQNAKLRNSIKELKATIDLLGADKAPLSVFNELDRKTEALIRGEQRAARFKKQIQETQREIAKLSGTKLGETFRKIGSTISGAFSSLVNRANSAGNAVSGLTSRLLRMAKTVFVFNLINKGFNFIRDGMQGVIAQDSILMNSLGQIKASLLTAFAPIWHACLPAIHALAKALAWVSKLIASVVSRLFGKTITQSTQMAQQMYTASQNTGKLNKGLKNTAKSAKKAARELASFDKIEVLNKDDNEIKMPKVSDSDVSGGGGAQPLKFPVQLEFETKNAELIDAISRVFKAMWSIVKPIIQGIKDDFTWLWGKLFGETTPTSWLNSLADWLEGIGKFINENPMVKDFLVSLAEGFIIATVAVGAFFAIMSLVNPVTAWILGLTAAIGLIIFAIKNWGKICEWFESIWPGVGEMFSDVWDDIVKTWEAGSKAFQTFWKTFGVFFERLFDGFINYLKDWGLSLWDLIKGVFEGVLQIFRGWIQGIQGIFKIFTGVFTGDWEKVWDGMLTVINGFATGFRGTINVILSVAENFVNGIIGMINGVTSAVSAVGGIFGFGNIGRIPRVHVPRLEQGAVLKGGNPFLAWVNDQPAGQTNIETPLSTMVQAFKVAMQDFQGNGQTNVVVEANGNMGELIRLLNFELKKEQNFRGNSFVINGVGI